MNKQQLASKIWASANKMRSNIEASEYKDYILGFIFYKFLSEKEETYLIDNGWSREDFGDLTEEDTETVAYIKSNVGYFISYDNLYSTWLKMGKDFDISKVKDALSAFNRNIHENHKDVFDNIFMTLDTGLSKLGNNTQAQTKAVRELIDLIRDIPMDNKQDYDVLGFIYEYLISNFAANAGKKAGEFYTPHEVSMLMSEIVAYHLRDREEIQIYDPTSGSGSLLINIGKCVSKHLNNADHIKYYAQELIQSTYNLTRMNLVMRGIFPSNIVTRCADTLAQDWPLDSKHGFTPLYVDAVVSNPPYSQQWDADAHVQDIRFSNYGIAPKSKADYAFLLHDLYHLRPDGIMTIVLPHGVLFRGGEEETIRTNLIDNNQIDAIIGLPANIFFGTGIPTIIIVLKKHRENNDVLIIDASKHFIKEGKNNKLQQSDIKRIVDAYVNRSTIDKFSRVVSKQEIKDNGYNLNIPRYVDSSEKEESIDIYASMFGGIPNNEIDELNKYWTMFPSLRSDLFKSVNDTPYSELKSNDVKGIIKNNTDVISFINNFNDNFADFNEYLNNLLLKDVESVEVNNCEEIIADSIFGRVSKFNIVDRYRLYQILDDCYKTISQDIEIIKQDGISCLNKVDPLMIIKKKDNKEIEVQDGWMGHILPFDLIEKTYFKEMQEKLNEEDSRLNEISSRFEELYEGLDEDSKNYELGSNKLSNNNGDGFNNSGVKALAKVLIKSKTIPEDESIEAIILEVNDLLSEEKELKASVKNLKEQIKKNDKEKLESLDINDCIQLLSVKWFAPLLESIKETTDNIVDHLVDKVISLDKKYETTLENLTSEIDKTENELASMIDDLVGDEFDMKGLAEFKKLLVGDENE